MDAVCVYSGYTGDEVCVDCGQIIGKVGDFVPAPSDDHTGEWELIEGTVVEATCYDKGYTGDYKCSDCGEIKLGTDLGYKHGHTTVKNTRKGTCVTPAYTGDIYCMSCHKVIRAGKVLSLDESNHVHTHIDLARAATCVKPGSTGYKVCDDCGKTLSTPKSIPALGHEWGEGVITKEATQTEPGVKTYRCTREGCNGIKTEDIPALSSTVIESVALTVAAPAADAVATAAATSETSCTVISTSWLGEYGNNAAVGDLFASGTSYTVQVELEAVEPNVFTLDTSFTVNGAAATVVAFAMDSVTLNYAFPATEGTYTPPTPPIPPSPPEDEYTVSVVTNGYGTASASPATGTEGTLITLSYSADTGYHFVRWQVINGEVTIVGNQFTMPASHVTVQTIFAEDETLIVPVTPKPNPVTPVDPGKPTVPETPVTPAKPGNPFVNVPAGEYYEDAVLWAAENSITGGVDTTHFAPDAACTRAQIVTFLWRAAGSPEPKGESSFTDVSADAYYAKAVAWAVEQGITGGVGGNTFAPDATCTRAQAVTFLYRAAGSPAVSSSSAFSDVGADDYYANAVAWAAANGITGGIGGGLFGSNNDCTRAQIVAFLYRSVK